MAEQGGIIMSIQPRRGRGPGGITFSISGDAVELTTFDPALLKLAAENISKQALIVFEERKSKDGARTYRNITNLTIIPQDPATSIIKDKEADITVCEVSKAEALVPIQTIGPSGLVPGQSIEQMEQGFALAVRRYELLQEFIRKHFVKDVHYNDGAMFNASKDVLLQPGAHMIAHAYGYSLLPEVLSGPMEPPKEADAPYTLVIKTTVVDARGRLVGAAFGAATSTIWSGKQGRYVGRAIDPDKSFNSTLKMAVKRSVVAAVRQSTDAASLFVEDVEEGGYGEGREPKGFIRKRR